jgi:putative transcriptional regulator
VTGEKKQPPEPAAIREARVSAGLTKAEAAKMVYATDRHWRYWEGGHHAMNPALWELFLIKVAQRAGGEA